MGIAGLRARTDSVRLRRLQITSELRTNSARPEAVREGAGEVRHRQRLDPIPAGETASQSADSQDRRVSREAGAHNRRALDVLIRSRAPRGARAAATARRETAT